MNPDHQGGPDSTLTSNEQISKNGRKPKSLSPSTKVTATGRLDQQPAYLFIMVGNHLSDRVPPGDLTKESASWPSSPIPAVGTGKCEVYGRGARRICLARSPAAGIGLVLRSKHEHPCFSSKRAWGAERSSVSPARAFTPCGPRLPHGGRRHPSSSCSFSEPLLSRPLPSAPAQSS